MEKESTINPGLVEKNGSDGYGLTQWTPPTKLTDWLGNKEKSDIDNQLSRLVYEANHEEQWLSSLCKPTMTFAQFTKNPNSCSVLAEYFCRCYENPEKVDEKVADRQTRAKKWSPLLGYLV